jgi:hypothetical protein
VAEKQAERPKAENGVLYVGPWGEAQRALVTARWPAAKVATLGPFTRIDLSGTARGTCPGFNDHEALAALSAAAPAIGFFCDGVAGAEGVRVFEQGRERDRRRVEWARPNPPDPAGWPIASLALTLGLPIEAITRVARPERPPLAVAVEALLNGKPAATSELRDQALQLLGAMDHAHVTGVLITHLKAEDWVARFHAVRAYARKNRGPGQEGRPALDALLADPDEGVRENALKGMAELVPEVAFSDRELQGQLDRAIARGLADEDDDVKAAATALREVRQKLLG